MKTYIYLSGLVFIAVLCMLSVFGAFLGADRAKDFFNSFPLAVFWGGFAAVFVWAIIAFRSLQRSVPLFVIHIGCVLVLCGGLIGSQTGIRFYNRLFGKDDLSKGYIRLYPHQTARQVTSEIDRRLYDLGMEFRLNQFDVLYYDNADGHFLIQDNQTGRQWQMPAQTAAGQSVDLPPLNAAAEVAGVYQNLQISVEDGRVSAQEGPLTQSNPGWQLRIHLPDGASETHYVFQNQAAHRNPQKRFMVSFESNQMVRDYVSDLTVLSGGKDIAAKKIEVNKPLYVRGYHLYQSSWGQDENGLYSVLQVVNSHGLTAVFAGYMLISAGLIWHFAVVLSGSRKNRKAGNAD